MYIQRSLTSVSLHFVCYNVQPVFNEQRFSYLTSSKPTEFPILMPVVVVWKDLFNSLSRQCASTRRMNNSLKIVNKITNRSKLKRKIKIRIRTLSVTSDKKKVRYTADICRLKTTVYNMHLIGIPIVSIYYLTYIFTLFYLLNFFFLKIFKCHLHRLF